MPVVAKGAKRPHSALRAVLVSFQPLSVRFSGKSDVKTLTQAEWLGGLMSPDGKALFAAYYLNELLMRGLTRSELGKLWLGGIIFTIGALINLNTKGL